MNIGRYKTSLPVCRFSVLCGPGDIDAHVRSVKLGGKQGTLHYHYTFQDPNRHRTIGDYNYFPVVLNQDRTPWYLGTLYIVEKIQDAALNKVSTMHNLASDLGVYQHWVENQSRDPAFMFDFPPMKIDRPTYRYAWHLDGEFHRGDCSSDTASRRMNAVVDFYRWLMRERVFEPKFSPWEEEFIEIPLPSSGQTRRTKQVRSTDLNRRRGGAKRPDPFTDTIQDGGKLRPMCRSEQGWLLEALDALGNTEMLLSHLIAISTGARIQTVFTLRADKFINRNVGWSRSIDGGMEVMKMLAGPGTGIDTKNSVQGVLQIPRQVFELISIYANSDRAGQRRELAAGHYKGLPYLFLSQQGAPFYLANADLAEFNPNVENGYPNNGGVVREFLREQVIPYVRLRHDKEFHCTFHDLRASFGMNMVEAQNDLVKAGKITPAAARFNVMQLLWHSSMDVTDRYLNYNANRAAAFAAVNHLGEQIQHWADAARRGFKDL